MHLSDVRIPGLPVFFGYVQTPGATDPSAHPITSLSVSEELGAHGFPTTGRIDLTAGLAEGGGAVHELGLDITPVAFGPVLLRRHRRPGQPLPPGADHLSGRRRPLGCGLGRVEPAPDLSGSFSGTCRRAPWP